jgi:RNA polymerase sigma-70 factor (ECF subfamily)
MDLSELLAERFEENRNHLRAVAHQMLGSAGDADDAVQEAWLRLSRSDTSSVNNLGGWLTTVVARVCLDMLRTRQSRRESPLSPDSPDPAASRADGTQPEHEAELADSVGTALLVVLEMLTPAERLAFVLHDTFDLPFEEIAPIVGRSPAAARQLASRARRRVQGSAEDRAADLDRQRSAVAAFLAASREGNFDALLELLDPEVVLRADTAAIKASRGKWAGALSGPEIRGARAVAESLSGRAQGIELALVDGSFGAAWAPGGRPRAAFTFSFANGKVSEIEVIVDPTRLREMSISPAHADRG